MPITLLIDDTPTVEAEASCSPDWFDEGRFPHDCYYCRNCFRCDFANKTKK